jgi:hypothetical protein
MIDYRSINRDRSRERFAGASRAVSPLVVQAWPKPIEFLLEKG